MTSVSQGAPGTFFQVLGTGFSSTASQNVVKFGTLQANVSSTLSGSLGSVVGLVVSVPLNSPLGVTSITVTVGGVVSNAFPFTVVNTNSTPTISNIWPNPAPQGTTIRISGSNYSTLANAITVKWGTLQVNNLSALSTTAIDFLLPASWGAGTNTLTVVSNGLTTAAFNFTISTATTSGGNARPTVPTASIVGSQPYSDNIQVNYTLSDADSSSCGVRVEYLYGGIPTVGPWLPCTAAAGQTVTGLSSSPTGLAKSFIWNSRANLPSGPYYAVYLRVIPSDAGGTGTGYLIASFTVANLVSTPSAASATLISLGTISRSSPVVYSLVDPQSQATSIRVEYTYPNIPSPTWRVATRDMSGGEGTTALTTSPGGVTHTFLWDTLRDIASDQDGVLVKLSILDSTGQIPGSYTSQEASVRNSIGSRGSSARVVSSQPFRVDSISPNFIRQGVSVQVTVTGAGFAAGTKVYAGAQCANVQIVGGKQITCTVPAQGAVGQSFDVRVVLPTGTEVVLPRAFTVR
jgi:hypothetical protein